MQNSWFSLHTKSISFPAWCGAGLQAAWEVDEMHSCKYWGENSGQIEDLVIFMHLIASDSVILVTKGLFVSP